MKVLECRGFPPKWCGWRKNIFFSSKVVVIFNSDYGSWISCRRGICQGDPLTPYLFILAIDLFSKLLNKAASNKIFEGLGDLYIIGGSKILQYVDDTLIFTKAKGENISVPKIILYSFKLISGPAINYQKSSAIVIASNDNFTIEFASWINY